MSDSEARRQATDGRRQGPDGRRRVRTTSSFGVLDDECLLSVTTRALGTRTMEFLASRDDECRTRRLVVRTLTGAVRGLTVVVGSGRRVPLASSTTSAFCP